MSFRSWVTVITLVLLALVVFFSRNELYSAWLLLDKVNLTILSLLIPLQFMSYYSTGGMIFSYLRSKGNMKLTTHWETTRMALELNFVNHILPSGGAAGFSYLGWVLARHGVSAGRATMAQIVRFVLTFMAFVMLILIAVIYLFFDNSINQSIVIISTILVVASVTGTFFIIYMVGNHKRLLKLSRFVTRISNKVVSFFTRGRKNDVVKLHKIEEFFTDLHQDFLEIKQEKKILIRPFMWAIITNLLDVALIWVAFWSFGYQVNPAIIFIAFGLASIIGVISSTPGGAGAYEATMAAFLASAGIPPDVAIAGTLLARVALLSGTVLFGYIFYQLTISKYGKSPTSI